MSMKKSLLLHPTAGDSAGELNRLQTELAKSPEDIEKARLEAVRARIKDGKELRVEIEKLKERMQKSPIKSAERTLAYRSLQQAKHWLGEDLNIAGAENPYPNSMKPENPIVDPQADMPQQNA